MIKKILLLVIICCLSCVDNKSDKRSATVNQEINVPTYNFEEFESSLLNESEKIYVINFWATWCAPCVEELPHFTKLAKQHKDVEVILVSLDMPNMKETQLIPFIKKKKINTKVVLLDDPRSNVWIPKIDENWDGAIPATLIYNQKNRKFYPRKFDTYQELVDKVKNFK